MPLKQINFRTSSFTGSSSRTSTGEELAGLITMGAKAYEAKQKIDIRQEKLDENELYKSDSLKNMKHVSDQSNARLEFMKTNPSFQEQESFETELKSDTDKFYKEDIQSKYFINKYPTAVDSHNSIIKRAYINGTKQSTSLMYEEINNSVKNNPTITTKEVTDSISFLNEASGITGTTYKSDSLYSSYVANASNDALSQNPLEFNSDEWKAKYPMLSELKDESYKKTVSRVNSTMATAKEGAINDINYKYKNDTYESILNANSSEELLLLQKRVKSDSTEHILGGTKQVLSRAIDTAMGKYVSMANKVKTEAKKELTSSMELFKQMTSVGGENTSIQNTRAIKYINSDAVNAGEAIIQNIYDLYSVADKDGKAVLTTDGKVKLLKVQDKFSQSYTKAYQVSNHTIGKSISSSVNADAKKILVNKYTKTFMDNVYQNSNTASLAMNSIGKVPDEFVTVIKDAINDTSETDNISIVRASLKAMSDLYRDGRSASIMNNNAFISSLVKANTNLKQPEKIMPLLRELDTKDGKETLSNSKSVYYKQLKKNSSFDDYPTSTINLLAEKLAYENYFGLLNEEDVVSNAEDMLENIQYEEDGYNVIDVNGEYTPDDLSSIGDSFSEMVVPHMTKDTTKSTAKSNISLRVNEDGGLSILSGNTLLYSSYDKNETMLMIDGFAFRNKQKSSNIGLSKTGLMIHRMGKINKKIFGSLVGKIEEVKQDISDAVDKENML